MSSCPDRRRAGAYNPLVKAVQTTILTESVPRDSLHWERVLTRERYTILSPSGAPVLRAVKGSRFALVPPGLRRIATVASAADGSRAIAMEVSGFLVPRASLEEAAGRFLREIAHPEKLSAASTCHAPPGRRWTVAAVCLLTAAAAFLAIGHRLITRSFDEIRRGETAWEFFPAAEPLSNVPAATPWIAAGFLAGTAGFSVGAALSAIFFLGRAASPLAEIFGGVLAWLSVFLTASLALGPPASGGGVGIARSMRDPAVLILAAAIPWAAWGGSALAVWRPGVFKLSRTPRAAGLWICVGLAGLLLGAAPVPSEAPLPVGLRPADIVRAIEKEYPYHQFRDRWLLATPVGTLASDLYYRYTPYADLSTNPDLYPDRLSLRLMKEAGITLWLAFPVVLLAGSLWILLCAVARRTRGSSRSRLWAASALAVLTTLGVCHFFWASPTAKVDHARAARDTSTLARLLAESRDAGLKAEAAHALAVLGKAEHVDLLRRHLADPDARVRLWCTTALGRLADWQSLPDFLKAAEKDPQIVVRSRAAQAVHYLAGLAPRTPEGTLAAVADLLGAPPAETARARLSNAALSLIVRARAQEEVLYVRRKLFLAETAWEMARSQ